MKKGLLSSSIVSYILVLGCLGPGACNYLFISMSPQLYIPGQHYSLLTVFYNIQPIQNKQFDISITMQLNQTTEKDQTNTIFDFVSCNQTDAVQCTLCYVQNYNCLNDRYAKSEPCLQICNYTGLTSFQVDTLLPSLFLNLNSSVPTQQTYIIDNTFYPCNNGAYQPELYLAELINISIQENQSYGMLVRISSIRAATANHDGYYCLPHHYVSQVSQAEEEVGVPEGPGRGPGFTQFLPSQLQPQVIHVSHQYYFIQLYTILYQARAKHMQPHHPHSSLLNHAPTSLPPIQFIETHGSSCLAQPYNYHEYAHILQTYVVRKEADAPTVGACLGYNIFLPSDKVLNLYQKYECRQFKKVCSLCKEIRVVGLILSFNHEPNLLNEISITCFPSLRILDISGNRIQSLEPLLRIETGSLKLLNVSGNKITNIRCLARIPYSSSCLIDLSNNLYNQIPQTLATGNIEFDARVLDKVRIYKLIFTLPSVQQQGTGRFLNEYFR